ncbi:hypothetical protein F4813DRAFT_396000 [Daldinia decipiens]|uniref:uncharacterized protein n=1 Tax=Daldinia decipiens TaxID=326647 RepID=UPI0020C2C475|nr:uncharacterized protein F4813DRAFT_396000 [Daldinia decipiens]KAI1657828.1 hypothetical protein F4813DRAFT_396000 [Daldinia decipiens]
MLPARMASFKVFSPGGQRPSKGSSSQSEQLGSQQRYNEVDNEVYLPRSNDIYITKTKGGKPALARKKHDRLPEDIGFDLFGQNIGSSSRADVEKRARRHRSFYSQSSGFASPSTPSQPHTPQTSFNNNNQARGYGASPAGTVRKSSLRSASISTPERIYRVKESPRNSNTYHDTYHDEVPGARDPNQMPADFSLPTQQIPMWSPLHTPVSPLSPASFWNMKANGNNTPTMEPAQGPSAALPTNPRVYATTQLPDYGGLRSLGQRQRQSLGVASNTQHVQPPAYMAPPSTAVHSYFQPHQYTALYPEAKSSAFPISGSMQNPFPAFPLSPVTPTTPPANLSPDGSSKAASNSTARFIPSEAKEFEEHYSATMKSQAQGTRTDEGKKEKGAIAIEEISKYIQHVHICAACGKKRSRGYQRAHPLKRGEIPTRDYCRKCLHHALKDTDNTDDDLMSGDTRESLRPTSYETADTIREDVPMDAKAWRSRKLRRRPTRLDLAPRIPSQRATRAGYTEPPLSVSSGEESDFGVSAPIPIPSPGEYHYRNKRAVSSDKEPRHKVNINISTSKLKTSRGRRESPADEDGRSTLRNAARAKSSNTTANHEPKGSAEATSGLSQREDFGRVYSSGIEVSSQAAASPKRRTRVPRPNVPKAVSEAVPKISIGAVPTLSEAPSLESETRDKVYKNIDDDDFERLSFLKEVQEFKNNYSNLDHSDPPAQRTAREGYDSAKENKPIHNRGPKTYNHDRKRPNLGTTPDFGQPYGGPGLRWHTYSSREQIGCYQDKPEARQEFQGHVGHTTEAEPDTPDTPTWPSTPTLTDLPYDNAASIPGFTDDYWGGGEEDEDWAENSARNLAEEELASAGKLFDDLAGGNWGESRTSSFFIPTFVTRTEISVESFRSSEEQNGATADTSTVTYQLAETSETGEDVDRNGSTRTFGSFKQKDGDCARTWMPPSYHDTWQRPDRPGLRETPREQHKNTMYHFDERESGSSFDLMAPDPTSSMAGHTGHSTENMPPSMFDYNQSTTSGGWHNRLSSRH